LFAVLPTVLLSSLVFKKVGYFVWTFFLKAIIGDWANLEA